MKKKVLFVMDTLRMGGAEKSLVSLLKLLDPNRLDISLLLFELGGPLQEEVPDYVHIIEADLLTRAMTLELRNYLVAILKKGHIVAALSRLCMSLRSRFSRHELFNWHIVSHHIPSLDGEYDVVVGYLEGFPDYYVIDKVTAKQKIGWIHIDFTGKKLLKEEKEYYKSFQYLVTISQICKDAIVKQIPELEGKIQILENITIPAEIIKKSEEKIDDTWDGSLFHIVSVGRLDFQKGMDIAAQSAKLLKENNLRFCWHVYGKGTMYNEISNYITDNRISDCFVLEGIRENPYPYMRKADILVQPSRWEGKSIVLDEAKILGKAIVVTDYPSVTDQITDGITGLIAEIDPSSICEKINQVIDNPTLRRSLELNASSEENDSIKAVEQFYKLIC